MIQALDRLPSRKSNEVTPQQRDFSSKVKGELHPGCHSQCQVITATHVYLVTKAGIVKFSSKRAGR